MDPIIATAKGLAKTWKQEAEKRRTRASIDAAADTLVSCAEELEALMADVSAETARLPLSKWARERGVPASTARRWCAMGQVPGAEQDASGNWIIPHEARRELRRRGDIRRIG